MQPAIHLHWPPKRIGTRSIGHEKDANAPCPVRFTQPALRLSRLSDHQGLQSQAEGGPGARMRRRMLGMRRVRHAQRQWVDGQEGRVSEKCSSYDGAAANWSGQLDQTYTTTVRTSTSILSYLPHRVLSENASPHPESRPPINAQLPHLA